MRYDHPDAKEVQKRLKVAFQALHDNGYFTAIKFRCCQPCGRAAVPKENSEKFVFYHDQDHEMLMERGECYLVWQGDGLEICKRLTEAKLGVNWDQDPSSRILVSLPSIN